MALAKGINSYATVSEANAYFENRVNSSAWEEADEGVKAQALVTATSILDSFDWQGTIKIESQALAFPRVGSYFDPKVGYEVNLKNEVPSRIINAVYEVAYHLLNNDGLLDSTGKVDSLSIGSITLTNIKSAGRMPSTARYLIKPLLQSRGQNAWWRAN